MHKLKCRVDVDPQSGPWPGYSTVSRAQPLACRPIHGAVNCLQARVGRQLVYPDYFFEGLAAVLPFRASLSSASLANRSTRNRFVRAALSFCANSDSVRACSAFSWVAAKRSSAVSFTAIDMVLVLCPA